jgi:hypothetical protein
LKCCGRRNHPTGDTATKEGHTKVRTPSIEAFVERIGSPLYEDKRAPREEALERAHWLVTQPGAASLAAIDRNLCSLEIQNSPLKALRDLVD